MSTTTYQRRQKCQNCGIPNFKHMFCPKCDKIIFVSYRFDGYIKDPTFRLQFLQGLKANEATTLAKLEAEAKKRDNNAAMYALAKRIRASLGSHPFAEWDEIFRRALDKAIHEAHHEVENINKKQEAVKAVYDAMAGVNFDSTPDNEPSPEDAAYDGFTPVSQNEFID